MLKFCQLLLRRMFKLVLSIAIISSISIVAFNSTAIADTNYENSVRQAETAADRVVEQDDVKNRFGKSENGDELLDNARNKASKKLNSLADKAKNSESDESLPHSERLFMRNLEGNN